MQTPDYIFELLYQHDCVIVPGFGGFVTNYRPAVIHPVLHTFSPPAKDILFNPLLQVNDGLLVQHIAMRENIPYELASQRLQQDLFRIREMLDQTNKCEIVNVGKLTKDPEGNLQFEPSDRINFLIASFGLGSFVSPAIQREHAIIRHEDLRHPAPVDRKPRVLPVALKRTLTIGLPAAAMLAFAIFSAGNIGQWLPQTSDLFPRLRQNTIGAPGVAQPVEQSARRFSKTTYDLRIHGLRKASPDAVRPLAVNPETGNFCIIGNCFSVEENARHYTEDLKKQGFAGASYFKPASANLYRAYFSRHQTREEAEKALAEIKLHNAPQAWILEM